MKYYRDLREYIAVLEANNKLYRIKRNINKDTEAMPLVRCQFRGLPEAERKAFLFEKVVDGVGNRFGVPLLVASHAPSRDVYAMAMMCEPEEIQNRWVQAQMHPIEPVLVEDGVVQQEVHVGHKLLEHGGLDEFPIPISTPGFDNAPYLTAANWVTKDPEIGIRNVGNYRGMVKSNNRLGICLLSPSQHAAVHLAKYRSLGLPAMPAAVVIGASPNIGLAAASKVPYGVDEYAVAGAIAGEPVQLVKCKTVDIEVPAAAEIVLEGKISTTYLEREGPFGEFHGHMGMESMNPYFEIACITHRKNPICTAFLSQFPPSESSKLRQLSAEATYYKFLKHDCNIPGMLDVALHEESGVASMIIVRVKKTYSAQPWQVLNATAAYAPNRGKIIIVVDEDIDPRDLNSVFWAVSWRIQPHRDIQVIPGKSMGLDYSTVQPCQTRRLGEPAPGSALLVDATRKWDYPPVSLPRKEFMEAALKIWEEEGLPKVSLRTPWYGYSLGLWTEENQEEADMALRGQHYQTGEKIARGREKLNVRGELK